jgi:acetylornithine deacetylase/succinyl-diaminopimelate desuccinylase-like protein
LLCLLVLGLIGALAYIRRRSRRPVPFVLATLTVTTALLAQTPKQAADQWRAAHEQQILQEFTTLLAIPNVASDKANIQRNADVLVAMLQRRHVDAKLLTAAGSNPVVYDEIKTPGARHTIVFYAHYDGQPVNPDDWETRAPFTPVSKMVNGEPRIFARAASDDKAAILAQLTALDALQAAHIPIKANLRFVWEGEEEAGSTNLGAVLEKYRDQLSGDVWLICDGPVDQSGRQSVVFGARGVTHIAITLYGPNLELHSGHYGNFAPNPAMMLAQLLGSMEDANGHVLVPHFYDGIAPLTPLEQQAIADAPRNEEKLRQEFVLGHTSGGGKPLLELLNEPTLNIDGFASARTGAKANNVVPSTATVDIDMRLVKGLDWKTQQQRVVDYIASQGYFITDATPDKATLLAHPRVAFVQRDAVGYNAVRTPMDLPIAQEVIAAVEAARGPVVKLPTMGGSVPLDMIVDILRTHTITVPIANYDNNQHSSNENIRLQNLWDGIETMAALEAMP